MSVHTDGDVLESSSIAGTLGIVDKDGGSALTLKPPVGFIPLGSKADTEVYDKINQGSWGNAPIYYIRINYDISSATPKKLAKPMIVPFTVKSEVAVPNLKYELSQGGVLKLVWSKVEGAEKYNIYNVANLGDLSGSNEEVSGAKNGYKGPMPILEATVTATEWDEFLKGTKGNVTKTGGYVGYQNEAVKGDYFVTAVKGGKESRFSIPVSTPGLSSQLPVKDKDQLSFTSFKGVSEVPKSTTVQFADGSTATRGIIYDTKNVKYSDVSPSQIDFSIKGTALQGFVSVKLTKAELVSLGTNSESVANSGNVEVENTTDQTPKSSVPTVIDPNSKSNSDKKDAEVTQVIDNTDKQVEDGDKEVVPVVSKDIKINADSALEEFLAIKIINGDTKISLKAFPEAQNFDTLTDIIQEVTYQNPLILGVTGFSYDYESLTLGMKYMDSKEEIKKKQDAITVEAKKIVGSAIKSDMTVEQKRKSLYDYLNGNTKYDDAALKNAEKNNFKSVDDSFNDSFTTYGIMVKKVGVCGSYASTYKMLADLADIECVVVAGNLDGVPHAWNKVKMEKDWAVVDTTNNGTNTGIPYFIYETSDKTAKVSGLTENKSWWLDSELAKFKATSDANEYYVANKLVVKDINDYKTKVEEGYKKGTKTLVLKLGAKLSEKDLSGVVANVFASNKASAKLEKAKFGVMEPFVVLMLE